MHQMRLTLSACKVKEICLLTHLLFWNCFAVVVTPCNDGLDELSAFYYVLHDV